jgi:hypothetical protein
MNITVESITDNEDGSSDCIVHVDEEAKDFLMRYAIIACLKDAIEFGKNATPSLEESNEQ